MFRDLHGLHPDRIVNKTNGITFRRWLFEANPALTSLLVDVLGPGVHGRSRSAAGTGAVRRGRCGPRRLREAAPRSKVALARLVADRTGMSLDPDALFDVQIKRIHEYKRQLLNVLHIDRALPGDARRTRPGTGMPRVKIFAGKAAAGYRQAKLVIKLIHDVARVVNADPAMRGRLSVAFLPNYNVSLAEAIIPAADLSEQISTAGMEASGTGNMKLALNGALTIGTLDGANIEILERVGADHFFLFGLTAAEVAARRAQGLDSEATIAAMPALGAGAGRAREWRILGR